MVINNIELEFDMMNAETADAYDSALKAAQDEFGLMKDSKIGLGEVIRRSCDTVRNVFDAIFGDGVGAEVCPDDNYKAVTECYSALIDEAKRQIEEMNRINQNLSAKYQGNREQRRAAARVVK